MRRPLRTLQERGDTWEHPLFEAEKLRHDKKLQLYKRIRRRHSDKDEAWWWDTLCINLNDIL